jgi:hypothetical protein
MLRQKKLNTDLFDRPVPLLWNVQINRNTKISIVGLMGLGILCVVPNSKGVAFYGADLSFL